MPWLRKPTFGIEDLKAATFDYGDKGSESHTMILTDQQFIEQDDGDPCFGLIKGIDGSLVNRFAIAIYGFQASIYRNLGEQGSLGDYKDRV